METRQYRIGRRLAAVAAAGIALAAASLAWWPRDSALAQVRRSGRLRIGVAVEAPYVAVDAAGALVGESPGVARAVCAALGVQPDWVLTHFQHLLDELDSGRFDMVAAGLFVNPERARRVRFSRPTLRVRPGWLTRAGELAALGPYRRALQRPELRVAVLAGSVEQALLMGLGMPAARLLDVPDAQAGMAAVAGRVADALALSLPTVAYMAAHSSRLLQAQAALEPGSTEGCSLTAFAFRQADGDLQQAVDDVLARYLGSAAHLALLQPLGLGRDDLAPPTHE